MRAYERLLEYVKVHTTSDPDSAEHPTSARQFDLMRILKKELEESGASRVIEDEHCVLYGFFDASPGYEDLPRIGFFAHMDTAPDFPGENVRAQIVEHYDGGAVPLGESGRVLDPAVFPHLKKLAGRTLITTDGTTLLGADDKAGIAEIMTMIETLNSEKIAHGPLAVCFTPDEEVGMGTDCVDLKTLGCAYAYTVDGGEEGEVVYENFNAASATVTFTGVNVHPGSAKGVMINASKLSVEYLSALPAREAPEYTEGYEGFFHLTDMEGCVERAKLSFIIRDHDRRRFEERKALMADIAAKMNARLPFPAVRAEISDSYYNMEEKIRPVFHVVERALAATREAGIEPVVTPIRGGTDGARLSYMGLPTPNLGTGGYAYHGPYEHITAEGMDAAVRILTAIAKVR